MADAPTSDGHETQLRVERWSVDLLDRIGRQRSDGRHLCDVVVACGDDGADAFPVHRCVLAASSEYFGALLSSTLGGGGVVRGDAVHHVTVNTSQLDLSRDVVAKVSLSL